ncbi:K transporting ATPase KdpC subunit [Candidatus Protofrankia californiensis]|uniref:K transporting ATPase KdpC subunit n=1 Tax=Candidatus Protofrankia californiensis TaxID=1839754 RepID=A0A1C3P6P7_9ACTN|nr:K transporting ATPase KdpC subunit [Candidatus Protofrankia californiensis]
MGAVLAVFYTDPGYSGAISRVVSVNEECPKSSFLATYERIRVECHSYGDDVSAGKQVVVRGNAPAHPVVPADAVTASGSGLDPAISPAYAALQAPRVARERGMTVQRVLALVDRHTASRALGFMGEPAVDVLQLNIDLDRPDQ